MVVYKCDRCNSYYEHEIGKWSIKGLKALYVGFTLNGTFKEKVGNNLDLCPSCTEDFNKFINTYNGNKQ